MKLRCRRCMISVFTLRNAALFPPNFRTITGCAGARSRAGEGKTSCRLQKHKNNRAPDHKGSTSVRCGVATTSRHPQNCRSVSQKRWYCVYAKWTPTRTGKHHRALGARPTHNGTEGHGCLHAADATTDATTDATSTADTADTTDATDAVDAATRLFADADGDAEAPAQSESSERQHVPSGMYQAAEPELAA